MNATINQPAPQAGFKRSFQHSQALFESAVAEFSAQGYDQASINTILKNAGMSKGQFYYHFENKEELYLALIEVLIEKKTAHLAAVARPEDYRQDIFAILQTQINYSLDFAQEYPLIGQFAESFVREQGSPIYDRALAVHNFENNAAMTALIESAYARGEFREDLPLAFIKKAVGYLFTHAADLADLNYAENFEENMAYLITFMRGGLGRSANEQKDETS
ncbi:MAG: TetR/AcrR family transcriptional regulator [Anaerolineales bacterium]|nr:TetR/AcrR family transcriptional regulator [Anaerolineales bacterium]